MKKDEMRAGGYTTPAAYLRWEARERAPSKQSPPVKLQSQQPASRTRRHADISRAIPRELESATGLAATRHVVLLEGSPPSRMKFYEFFRTGHRSPEPYTSTSNKSQNHQKMAQKIEFLPPRRLLVKRRRGIIGDLVNFLSPPFSPTVTSSQVLMNAISWKQNNDYSGASIPGTSTSSLLSLACLQNAVYSVFGPRMRFPEAFSVNI
ncbi:hypothetical protein B0H14DRAFT_3472110 [Mycena olivaceomarginata]|nr:hypothetical protein B0H14DRAFT_3472110 [Mycena olivaceomarginata]